MRKILFNLFAIIILINTLQTEKVCSQTIVQWYTSMGTFRAELREDIVPITANNFISLTNSRFYDNLVFHRVISGFMIQDGCPEGTGYGGPGYTIPDEFSPLLRHDQAGILSMANAGPNTGGSQYFITVAPTAWLDDLHAVFGKVIDGLDVVFAISNVTTDANDRPIVDVEIDSVRVVNGTPELNLVSPVGGEVFLAGVEQKIKWESNFLADVKIEYSNNNGSTWIVIDTVSSNLRYYKWMVPSELGTNFKIRISNPDNPDGLYDVSENSFSIGSFDFTQITGYNPKILSNSPIEVNWSSTNFGLIKIEYLVSQSQGYKLLVDNYDSEQGTYIWNTPDTTAVNCCLRVSSCITPDAARISTRFTLCSLELLAPQENNVWESGSVKQITWSASKTGNLKIEYSYDDGTNWVVISSSANSSTSLFNWDVPNTPSTLCKLRIYPSTNSLFKIENQGNFTISPANAIQSIGINHIKFIYRKNENKYQIEFSELRSDDKFTLHIYNNLGICIDKYTFTNPTKYNTITLDSRIKTHGVYYFKISGTKYSQTGTFLSIKH